MVYTFFILSLLVAGALAAPSEVHHRHAALALRYASPEPVAALIQPIRRRRVAKRCPPRESAPVNVQAGPEHSPSPKPPSNPDPPPQHSDPRPPEHSDPPPQHSDPPPPQHSDPPPQHSNPPPPPPPPPTGGGTYYDTGLGACGITNTDGDYIAAVSHELFDIYPGYAGGNPNNNPICGKRVTATFEGKSVTVIITDRCEACKMWDLDFSPAAFNTLADPGRGRIHGVQWSDPR